MPERAKVSERTETVTAVPKMFAVILHNDDYTTMDFVVEMLVRIFRKDTRAAAEMMMQVHEQGSCVVGVYSFDIAMTKKLQAALMAEKRGFPLKITVSEATE